MGFKELNSEYQINISVSNPDGLKFDEVYVVLDPGNGKESSIIEARKDFENEEYIAINTGEHTYDLIVDSEGREIVLNVEFLYKKKQAALFSANLPTLQYGAPEELKAGEEADLIFKRI